jgi:UDP-N-acetylmuramate dehydrogenase
MLNIPGLQKNVVLAPYTTYKIGGPADYFVSVDSAEALAHAVKIARDATMPYIILGCGANILIRDKGIRGLVIHNAAQGITYLDNNQIKAESGVIVADLINQTMVKGLSGFEHFAGIPSTIGGALWQNLHFLSPDRQRTLYIEEITLSATLFDEKNQPQTVTKDFFEFGYDTSILHHKSFVVLDATFQLTPASKETLKEQVAANLAWRNERQPQLVDFPSCGSVFKKIEGVGAGRLIDQAGLKGTIIGDAQISPKHANFIVNLGHAKAQDVLDLIKLAQLEVKRKLGYSLETEITILGE